MSNQKTVLVLGGNGFIGAEVVRYLQRGGAKVLVGTRAKHRYLKAGERRVIMHQMLESHDWLDKLCDVDVVVNTVGILRQRPNETYRQVHHLAVKSLATACHALGCRLVHISALGLGNPVASRFLTSKSAGEQAIKDSDADWCIVRPSLIDGEGGYGAKWFRKLAKWPIHFVPASARGKIAPIRIENLGEAIANIAMGPSFADAEKREIELGGPRIYTLKQYLMELAGGRPRASIKVPAIFARLLSHVLDVLHLTPFSFAHYELLKFDNCPKVNVLDSYIAGQVLRITAEPGRRAGLAVNGIPGSEYLQVR